MVELFWPEKAETLEGIFECLADYLANLIIEVLSDEKVDDGLVNEFRYFPFWILIFISGIEFYKIFFRIHNGNC